MTTATIHEVEERFDPGSLSKHAEIVARNGTRSARRRACMVAIVATALMPGALVSARLVEVTDCGGGNAIEERARYVLTTDVDCSGEADPVVLMADGSVLELGGHTLSNGDVVCFGSCRVVGPGMISGGGVIGSGRVVVLRTTITGSPANGVLATNVTGHARATIIDSLITGSAMTGVEADRMTRLIRSRIVDNGRHGVAVSVQPFNNCRRGRIRSWQSTISGNGRSEKCATHEICADVASCARRGPALRTSQCDTSYELASGMPGRSCGVCTLD